MTATTSGINATANAWRIWMELVLTRLGAEMGFTLPEFVAQIRAQLLEGWDGWEYGDIDLETVCEELGLTQRTPYGLADALRTF
jgi:hypothetical protein